jgi:hypothetical protein
MKFSGILNSFFLALMLFKGALFLAASPAFSQIRETGTSGVWTSYEVRTSNGLVGCGIDSNWSQYSVGIVTGTDGFFDIFLYNLNWTFTQTSAVRIAIRLGRQRWEFSGEARPGRESGRPDGRRSPASVLLEVPPAGTAAFWAAFRSSSDGAIDFLTGNEGSWRLNLSGSNAASLRFFDCILRLGDNIRPFDVLPPGDDSRRDGTVPKSPQREGNTKSPF